MSRLRWTAALLTSLCLSPAADIEILRDRWGVPHIYAKNIDDLFCRLSQSTVLVPVACPPIEPAQAREIGY